MQADNSAGFGLFGLNGRPGVFPEGKAFSPYLEVFGWLKPWPQPCGKHSAATISCFLQELRLGRAEMARQFPQSYLDVITCKDCNRAIESFRLNHILAAIRQHQMSAESTVKFIEIVLDKGHGGEEIEKKLFKNRAQKLFASL